MKDPAADKEQEMDGAITSEQPKGAPPVVLSEGASIALGNVLSRFLVQKPKKGDSKRPAATGKRPRGDHKHVVLADDEQVVQKLSEDRELKRRAKELKRQKLEFENNGHVVPDVTLEASFEKQLHATATKGAVALFNAVSKAQKAADDATAKAKKKGPPVSRDKFMDMMKAGANKNIALPMRNVNEDKVDSSDSDDTGAAGNATKTGRLAAKWLKDDFLTKGVSKLKDWDREEENGSSSESSGGKSTDEEGHGNENEDDIESEASDDGDEDSEDSSA